MPGAKDLARDAADRADWENEGGSLLSQGARVPAQEARPAEEPSRYLIQPAGGFPDASGRCYYQFHRVYAPVAPDPRGQGVQRIDEDRCFWEQTFRGDASRDTRVRRICYRDAKKLKARLSFQKFEGLHDALKDLFAR